MGGNFTEYLNYLEQIAHGSGGTVLLIRLAEIKSEALGTPLALLRQRAVPPFLQSVFYPNDFAKGIIFRIVAIGSSETPAQLQVEVGGM